MNRQLKVCKRARNVRKWENSLEQNFGKLKEVKKSEREKEESEKFNIRKSSQMECQYQHKATAILEIFFNIQYWNHWI